MSVHTVVAADQSFPLTDTNGLVAQDLTMGGRRLPRAEGRAPREDP